MSSWKRMTILLKVRYVGLSLKKPYILFVAYPQMKKMWEALEEVFAWGTKDRKHTLMTKLHTCRKENLSIPKTF